MQGGWYSNGSDYAQLRNREATYRPKGPKHLSLSQLVITRELAKRITYGRGKHRMLLGHARVNAVSRWLTVGIV